MPSSCFRLCCKSHSSLHNYVELSFRVILCSLFPKSSFRTKPRISCTEVLPVKKRNQWLFMYTMIIFVFFAVLYGGNRAVTVISENIPPKRDLCIIIDAGHGGIDGGATSCTGKLESGFNLEISVRLNDLFHLLGYKTRMIRTADTRYIRKALPLHSKKFPI